MDHAPTYNRHTAKLLAKAETCTVIQLDMITYRVRAPTGDPHFVVVRPTKGTTLQHTCDCRWREYHPDETCAHILAVELFLAQQANARLSLWEYETDAKRQHRTIRRIGDLYATVRR